MSLFDSSKELDPFVHAQRRVLADPEADDVDVLTALVRLAARDLGQMGELHLMGHRGPVLADRFVEHMEATGWRIVPAERVV